MLRIDALMSNIEPVPAATVVLARESAAKADIEILLLLRNSRLVFHGGHWVFPGGRIDTADFAQCERGLEYHAAVQAAVRETREEAGIDIDASQLVHTAHWTTPPRLPRRFSTWFFICPLLEAVTVSVDNSEIQDHRCITPTEALAAAAAESLILPRPTITTLEDIASLRSIDDLMRHVSQASIRVFPPDSIYYRPAEMGFQAV
jgi:8-oxo-dGTP pyrophosphatase MutT (NUDIX family)